MTPIRQVQAAYRHTGFFLTGQVKKSGLQMRDYDKRQQDNTKAKRNRSTSKREARRRRVLGYDVWIRQEDGSRKRYREFTFATKAEAAQALAALKTAGWKARYGLKPATIRTTSIKEAIDTYLKLAMANLQANRTDESSYWRNTPGHLRTLERWGHFVGLNRAVNSIQYDDFVFWV